MNRTLNFIALAFILSVSFGSVKELCAASPNQPDLSAPAIIEIGGDGSDTPTQWNSLTHTFTANGRNVTISNPALRPQNAKYFEDFKLLSEPDQKKFEKNREITLRLFTRLLSARYTPISKNKIVGNP